LQVIGVGPVELELGEFGVVLVRNAFVTEIAPDLVHFFQIANQQALEIQFERDAQVHLLFQFVVISHKGTAAAPP
jgi:hypothetical protein